MNRSFLLYFLVSISLFISLMTKGFLSTRSFSGIMVFIFQSKLYIGITLNLAFAIVMYAIGSFQAFISMQVPSSLKYEVNKRMLFVLIEIFSPCVFNHEYFDQNMLFRFTLVLSLRYAVYSLNVRIKSFELFDRIPTASDHSYVAYLHIIILLCFMYFGFYYISILRKDYNHVLGVLMMQCFYGCINIFHDMVRHYRFLINQEGLEYYNKKKTALSNLYALIATFLIQVLYILYFFNQFPFFVYRPLFSDFIQIVHEIYKYIMWTTTADMLERMLPDVTESDLENEDSCIICRGKLVPGPECKKLKCSHCYHLACLQQWVQEKSKCPLCQSNLSKLLSESIDRDKFVKEETALLTHLNKICLLRINEDRAKDGLPPLGSIKTWIYFYPQNEVDSRFTVLNGKSYDFEHIMNVDPMLMPINNDYQCFDAPDVHVSMPLSDYQKYLFSKCEKEFEIPFIHILPVQ